MRDPVLAGKIIKAVVDAVSVPVTVKIRSRWNPKSINAVEISKIAEDSGASAVVVHGRTADQGFSGHADWNVIAGVKNAVKIPVIRAAISGSRKMPVKCVWKPDVTR